MRRTILIVGTFTSILISVYLHYSLTTPRHRITEDSFAKIGAGMTEQEVEAIFGAPAGDYGPGKAYRIPRVSGALEFVKEAVAPAKEWLAGEFAFRVGFASDGRVRWKNTSVLSARSPSTASGDESGFNVDRSQEPDDL
ncbi:MAG: hypothetical protein L0215_27120 [Gemmataceae bacterium]|nr:hypothetical protein [Gemmataceae bacterium]